MGALSVARTRKPSWSVNRDGGTVEILLSPPQIAAFGAMHTHLAGFEIRLSAIDPVRQAHIDISRNAQVIVIEMGPDSTASMKLVAKLRAEHPTGRILAATVDDSLPNVRALLRAGAHDVIALPLDPNDLAQTLSQLRNEMARDNGATRTSGRVISVVKSMGGVGATSLLTQIAPSYAQRELASGRDTCLFDLDLQFGDAATYLGLTPSLSIRDLLDAGNRIDGSLLRSTRTRHASGLDLFAAPTEMMPLEAADGDHLCQLIDLAAEEYNTVFVDLPGTWTNWSLSIVARSELVLLVTQISIASLRQARRVLDLIEQQHLDNLEIQVVVNRLEQKMFGTINLRDAAAALGREISLSVSNDFKLMSSALDQGVPLSSISARNRLSRDIEKIVDGIEILSERG